MTDVQVENMVVSFSIGVPLDLPHLAGMLPDVKYNPDDVPALVLEFDKPRSIATLLSTGVVVVTGPRSMDEVHEVQSMVLGRLRMAGVRPQGTPEISVQNVAASTDLCCALNLRSLVKSLPNAKYERKTFPGVVYTGEDPNTVILLFDSGKIICNAQNLETVTVALEKMVEKLSSFGIKKEEKTCQK